MQLAGNLIGYAAVAVSVVIYQQKTRFSLLLWKAISDALWICHYFLIGGFTGAAVTCVALLREIVFFKNDRRSRIGVIALACFLCISIVSSILTWSSVFSIFALIGSLISIVSFWIGEPKLSRILAFPISGCMLVYGISNGSVAVLINEILVISSASIALLRSWKQTV